jgi:hypothetical protein
MAAVERHGAEEAGAIFVVIDRLDGSFDLYGPAPQSELGEDMGADRLFQKVLDAAPGDELRGRIERERKFDPDIWVITIEDRHGRALLEVV